MTNQVLLHTFIQADLSYMSANSHSLTHTIILCGSRRAEEWLLIYGWTVRRIVCTSTVDQE